MAKEEEREAKTGRQPNPVDAAADADDADEAQEEARRCQEKSQKKEEKKGNARHPKVWSKGL